MNYYEPRLTLTLVDPISQEYELKTEIFYPAMETGQQESEKVVGHERLIEIEVVTDSSFQHDHLVTSTQTYQRQAAEDEVVVTVRKDKKKKGQGVIIYSGTAQKAA